MQSLFQRQFFYFLTICMVGLLSYCGDRDIVPDPHWEAVATGFEFPEGPAWDGKRTLYLSDCSGGWIARYRQGIIDTLRQHQPADEAYKQTNGLTVGPDGFIYACEFGRGQISRLSPTGDVQVYSAEFENCPFKSPNDLTFDEAGNLYFTDPHSYDPQKPDGAVYKISADTRETIPVITGLAFPNGIAFTPDGRYLYVCESARHRILRFPVISPGEFGARQILIQLPGGDPDGIAFDRKGNLYVAHFGGGTVYVIGSDSRILQTIPTPGNRPTNLEFGGPLLRTLYLTEVETKSLYRMPVRIPGHRLN